MKQMNTEKSKIPYWRWLRFLPAVLWMSVIFVLSSRTGEEINTVLPLFQRLFPYMTGFNWGHYVSYFILAMTLDFGIGPRAERLGMKVVIVLICGLYGVTDEFHQSFVGGRMMDAMDVRNDIIGAVVWTFIVAIPPIRRIWRRVISKSLYS